MIRVDPAPKRMGYFSAAFLVVAAFCLQGSRAGTVSYGDLGDFHYGVGAPACHNVMPESPEAIVISFNLYTASNKNSPQTLIRTSPSSIRNSNFNALRNTKFVIHGYLDTYTSPWQQDLKDALVTKSVNVIMVDWHEGASHVPNYFQSAANTRVVGREIAKMIQQLRSETGASYSSMHVIGHSLGAHTAGYAGEALYNDVAQRAGRVTGLDPAGPAFRGYSEAVCRLDQTDADFVDAIHTDGDYYGLTDVSGHQDFYPNGGIMQAGCESVDPLIPCNHMRVVPLFTESVTTSCKFSATTKCSSFSSYPSCPGCGLSCPEMGYNAQKSAGSGLYFLDTNGASPFCM